MAESGSYNSRLGRHSANVKAGQVGVLSKNAGIRGKVPLNATKHEIAYASRRGLSINETRKTLTARRGMTNSEFKFLKPELASKVSLYDRLSDSRRKAAGLASVDKLVSGARVMPEQISGIGYGAHRQGLSAVGGGKNYDHRNVEGGDKRLNAIRGDSAGTLNSMNKKLTAAKLKNASKLGLSPARQAVYEVAVKNRLNRLRSSGVFANPRTGSYNGGDAQSAFLGASKHALTGTRHIQEVNFALKGKASGLGSFKSGQPRVPAGSSSGGQFARK